MSDKDLKVLRAERSQLRRVFTNSYNDFYGLLDEGNAAFEDLELAYRNVVDKAERLHRVDQKVSDVLYLVVNDEEELSIEFDTTEMYREKWIRVCAKWSSLSVCNVERSALGDDSNSTKEIRRNFKLPKFELPKYDGQIKNWISFWAQFKKVHDDKTLDNVDKFRYLLQATEPGSPARELVESYPPSDLNYDKAVEQLKKRFGNEDLLKRFYVRELLKLILSKNINGEKSELRILYDQLTTQLRSLETLKVTAEQYSCFLFPLIESAIPEHILIEWDRRRSEERVNNPDKCNTDELTDLLSFLEREVVREERLILARSTFCNTSGSERKDNRSRTYEQKKYNSDVSKYPTATDLVNVNRNVITCLICKGPHLVEHCFKARDMKCEDIKDIIKESNGCFRCLRANHSRKQCKVTLRCIICEGAHPALLCPERKSRTGKEDGKLIKEDLVAENNLTNSSCTNGLLQTLRVTVRGKAKREIRVLIDTGSQRSYLTKRMVQLMGYKPLYEEKLAHALFGGSKTEVQTHHCYQVKLSSLDQAYQCNFEALDSETICQQVPVAALGSWVEEIAEKGISLSDSSEGPIDALIGADVAGKLLTGRKETLSSGLVAVETRLGWTVMGRVRDSSNQKSGRRVEKR